MAKEFTPEEEFDSRAAFPYHCTLSKYCRVWADSTDRSTCQFRTGGYRNYRDGCNPLCPMTNELLLEGVVRTNQPGRKA